MLVKAVEHAVYGTAVYGAEYKKVVASLEARGPGLNAL
jgi:hypothetical protein